MQIRFGKTRIVLLVKDKAIKIGKVRIARLFFRMITFPFLSRSNHSRFYKRYGPTLLRAMWHYLISGLLSNRNEYEYYQGTFDVRVMPTVKRTLGGWIVIQHRGTAITARELSSENPFFGLPVNPDFLERDQPWQFCRNSRRCIVLVDYGRKETCEALRSTRNILLSGQKEAI